MYDMIYLGRVGFERSGHMNSRKKRIILVIVIAIVLIVAGVTAVVLITKGNNKVGEEKEVKLDNTPTYIEVNTTEDVVEEDTETAEEDVEPQDEVTTEASGSNKRDDSTEQIEETVDNYQPASDRPTTEEQETSVNVETTTEAADTTEGKVWVEPVYEEVWVVDREEQIVELPIYETRGKCVCNGCGADITNDPNTHISNPYNDVCDSWHSEAYQVIVGYETIVEPEEGHYETVLIEEGHWE